jgi:hypothetical protein
MDRVETRRTEFEEEISFAETRTAGGTKKIEERTSLNKKFFRDTQTGEAFDPKKKFGDIEKNNLIYDNVTTSYPLNLPIDYYQKYINSTVPKGDQQWFIRPHHLETLTSILFA